VIDLELTEENEVESHEIDEDLLDIDGDPAVQPGKGEEPWKPFFYSKDFWEDHPNKQLDHYIIAPSDFLKLASKTAQHREMFLD